MLESHILLYLMEREAKSNVWRGRMMGHPVAPLMYQCGVPRATFYRAVKSLLDQGMIVKQKNGYYLISRHVRSIANACKNAEEITR